MHYEGTAGSVCFFCHSTNACKWRLIVGLFKVRFEGLFAVLGVGCSAFRALWRRFSEHSELFVKVSKIQRLLGKKTRLDRLDFIIENIFRANASKNGNSFIFNKQLEGRVHLKWVGVAIECPEFSSNRDLICRKVYFLLERLLLKYTGIIVLPLQGPLNIPLSTCCTSYREETVSTTTTTVWCIPVRKASPASMESTRSAVCRL